MQLKYYTTRNNTQKRNNINASLKSAEDDHVLFWKISHFYYDKKQSTFQDQDACFYSTDL